MMIKCFVCGKEFDRTYTEEYIYKKTRWIRRKSQTIYFCGWNCMRQYERTEEEKEWQKSH